MYAFAPKTYLEQVFAEPTATEPETPEASFFDPDGEGADFYTLAAEVSFPVSATLTDMIGCLGEEALHHLVGKNVVELLCDVAGVDVRRQTRSEVQDLLFGLVDARTRLNERSTVSGSDVRPAFRAVDASVQLCKMVLQLPQFSVSREMVM